MRIQTLTLSCALAAMAACADTPAPDTSFSISVTMGDDLQTIYGSYDDLVAPLIVDRDLDFMVDGVAARLIGGDALRIAEAVRRRRLEASAEDVFIERLLGLQLTAAQVQRGKNFVSGVVDRAGEAGLLPMFSRPGALPTPAELDPPGLWLARLEVS